VNYQDMCERNWDEEKTFSPESHLPRAVQSKDEGQILLQSAIN
jgi:hypothetical protein